MSSRGPALITFACAYLLSLLPEHIIEINRLALDGIPLPNATHHSATPQASFRLTASTARIAARHCSMSRSSHASNCSTVMTVRRSSGVVTGAGSVTWSSGTAAIGTCQGCGARA